MWTRQVKWQKVPTPCDTSPYRRKKKKMSKALQAWRQKVSHDSSSGQFWQVCTIHNFCPLLVPPSSKMPDSRAAACKFFICLVLRPKQQKNSTHLKPPHNPDKEDNPIRPKHKEVIIKWISSKQWRPLHRSIVSLSQLCAQYRFAGYAKATLQTHW